HIILQHLDSPGTYARILFVDFSSAFNTIAPALLQDKLTQLSVPESTCRWITDFLSDRKQRVRLGNLIGLISNGDEAAYRKEVNSLTFWCSQNHLELNALKTVEMVADFG